jgi:hypothetical protein
MSFMYRARMGGLFLFCALFLFAPCHPGAFAQAPDTLPAPPEPLVPASDPAESAGALPPGDEKQPVYYIREIRFIRTGLTRSFALRLYGELREGEVITGKENLDRYIDLKTRLLLNQRVLESVTITYETGEAEPDGLLPVDLTVTTIDTWNIIALPYPKFDTNTGLEFIFKARDYNFLGTMNPLRIDLGAKMDAEYVERGFFSNLDRLSYVFEIDSDTPIKALGYLWNLNFDHFFSYTHGEPLSYKNNTGLSIDLPVSFTTLTLGFEESFMLHEENEERYQETYGKYFADQWYMSSELYAALKIPLGFTVGPYGGLNYTPRLTGKLNYRPGGDIGDLRRGPTLTFLHSLGFGKINWVNNFRDGVDASLSNSMGYNFFSAAWEKTIALDAAGHFPLSSFFAISGRLQYQHWFDRYHDNAGIILRGLLNKSLAADYLLSLNLDFTFQVFRFLPSQWLQNPNLHIFDFEFHASPFLDLAMVRDPVRNIQFNPRDMIAAGGIECIVFPFAMRSIYVRFSIGFNLREFFKTGKLPEGDGRELFIGLGHHY